MLSPYQFILCSAFARVKDKLLEQNILTPWTFKVLAITNAADFDKTEGEPLWRVDEDIDALKSLWYEVKDLDLRQETQISLKEKLPQYDAVFVSGGNGFWLLECMKKSGFTALIREFLKKGIYIYRQVQEVVSVLLISNTQKMLMTPASLN